MKRTAPLILAEGVEKVYPPGVHALRDFSFTMMPGEFVALVGPSGCGKTTFLRIVAGFEVVQAGRVRFCGEEIVGPDPRRQVLFQDIRVFPWMTVEGNVGFGLEARGRVGRDHMDAALHRMGLSDVRKRYPHELSVGTQQKVALARLLLAEPELILCDEPFNFLDWTSREFLQTEVLKLWHDGGKSVLFVTHNVAEAVFVAQRVIVMTARPGTVRREVDIPLPPRRWEMARDNALYLKLVREVSSLIEEEVRKAREMEAIEGF